MSAETIKLKEQQVAEYVEKFGKAKSVVLVDYRGLNVAEDTLMRNDLRKANVEYKVIKNRLVLRAFNNAGIAGFDTVLEGPTAMAISYDDAVAPAKIIVDNVKKTNPGNNPGGRHTRKARARRSASRYVANARSRTCSRAFRDCKEERSINLIFLKNKIILIN